MTLHSMTKNREKEERDRRREREVPFIEDFKRC
jgi:hypothetical protein